MYNHVYIKTKASKGFFSESRGSYGVCVTGEYEKSWNRYVNQMNAPDGFKITEKTMAMMAIKDVLEYIIALSEDTDDHDIINIHIDSESLIMTLDLLPELEKITYKNIFGCSIFGHTYMRQISDLLFQCDIMYTQVNFIKNREIFYILADDNDSEYYGVNRAELLANIAFNEGNETPVPNTT